MIPELGLEAIWCSYWASLRYGKGSGQDSQKHVALCLFEQMIAVRSLPIARSTGLEKIEAKAGKAAFEMPWAGVLQMRVLA